MGGKRSAGQTFLAVLLHILSLIGTGAYSWWIYQYFIESKDSISTTGRILTGIHLVVVLITTVIILISSIKSRKILKVALGFYLASVCTGMRYYFVIYFTPPLWRSFLLIIPGLMFVISASIRDKNILDSD